MKKRNITVRLTSHYNVKRSLYIRIKILIEPTTLAVISAQQMVGSAQCSQLDRARAYPRSYLYNPKAS